MIRGSLDFLKDHLIACRSRRTVTIFLRLTLGDFGLVG
jgi:hypothetical protein